MKNSGLNTKDAMARLMGNKKLYLKLLDCFRQDYSQFDEQIILLLQGCKRVTMRKQTSRYTA